MQSMKLEKEKFGQSYSFRSLNADATFCDIFITKYAFLIYQPVIILGVTLGKI